MQSAPELSTSVLEQDTEAEICVVGAGIAGLTTAYMLAKEGRRVVVLDDGPVGGGESSRTTAHAVNALDDRYVDLMRMHGKEGARLAAESHTAAIDWIERIAQDEFIACDFARLDGYLILTPGEPKELLQREWKALREIGLRDAELMECVPQLRFDTGLCIRFPRQAQFHIMHYLHGLAGAIERRGGRIFTRTRALSIVGGEHAHVETDAKRRVSAKSIVVATNTPVNDRFSIHTKQAAYRTYVIAARIPISAFPHILLWDTGAYSRRSGPVPYHYVRAAPLPGNDPARTTHMLLIVGGEDHKTGQADDAERRYAQLERWTKERFPEIETIEARWSGQVMEPVDGLAYIGRNPSDADNVFIATGDSGNGITHGTIAGLLLTDLILGRANPWETLYAPTRKPLRALKEFARENINVSMKYAEHLKGGEVRSEDDIERGSGAVLQRGARKIALHRDDAGGLHALSAMCPHLGCVVHWNSGERTWDCPCHGSRFTPDGHAVNGPANRPLAPLPVAAASSNELKSPR